MSVYVDALRQWPTPIKCFQAGSCHLLADTPDELHAMAAAIGLKRAWFQNKRPPHYDLTPAMRARAIRRGALEITDREMVSRFLLPSTPNPAPRNS